MGNTVRIHTSAIEHIAELNKHHYIEYVDVKEYTNSVLVTVAFDDGTFDNSQWITQ